MDHVATAFDQRTGKIETYVELSSYDDEVLLVKLQSMAGSKLTESTRPEMANLITTKVENPGVDISTDDTSGAHIGGEEGAEWHDCTMGFVVTRSNGPRGILMAGHCRDDGYTDDGVTLSFYNEGDSDYRDLQWVTGTQNTPDHFYQGSDDDTEVNRVGASSASYPVVGQRPRDAA